MVAVLAAIWVFRFAQPYAFASGSLLDFSFDPRWTRDVEYWRAVQSGEADAPPSTQWATRPLSFVTSNMVVWGMGPALGLAALAGLAFASFRVLTSRRMPPTWMLVLIGWPAFHLVYYSLAFTRTMRYIIPAYPFLILLAAAGLIALYGWGRTRWPRRDWVFALPAVGVVTLTALYALAFQRDLHPAGIQSHRIGMGLRKHSARLGGHHRALGRWSPAGPSRTGQSQRVSGTANAQLLAG